MISFGSDPVPVCLVSIFCYICLRSFIVFFMSYGAYIYNTIQLMAFDSCSERASTLGILPDFLGIDFNLNSHTDTTSTQLS